MGTFVYTTGIPAGSNNPSNDQPDMQTNTNSISSLIAIDHVGFNDASAQGGWHTQVHFNTTSTQATPTDPTSILYTSATGTASSKANLYFKNATSSFPLSFLRAYGCFDSTGAALGSQSFNVSCVNNSVGNYTATIAAGIITGTSYGVMITVGGGGFLLYSYKIVSNTSFTFAFIAPAGGSLNPNQFTLAVYQL